MKKLILILFLFVKIFFVYSQIPQSISYQGVANNANGTPITTPISLRISILDSSATGSEIYKETFTAVETTSQGVYSINIGLGTPVTGTFSSINWGTNLKFIKVEMDATPTGSNYVLVGTSQLMSVPYALYSENSKNNLSLKTYNNITELRSVTGSLNEMVFIKGHTSTGDGGEGYFIFKEIFTQSVSGTITLNDNNGTIIRDNTKGYGWIRIIKDKINVKFFGIKFNKEFEQTQDHTEALQKAITFASNNALNVPISELKTFRDYTDCGSTVYIPAGVYKISGKLTLKYGVNIEGDGTSTTILKADNSINPSGSLIDLDGGIIAGINISNLTFDGNTKVENQSSTSYADAKNCFYLKAKKRLPEDNTGGLWASTFKNIGIQNFNGSGIILEGSGLNSQLTEDYSFVNQFITFENIRIKRQRDISMCVLIRGATGQITFTNCVFDGVLESQKTSKAFNVAIETNGVEAAVINFSTCTFQYSEIGVKTTYGESITFDTCWFETLDFGVYAANSQSNTKTSKCINILNSRFANASGFGSLEILNKNLDGGSCISVEGGSSVNVSNNYVLTTENIINQKNFFIKNYGLDSKINLLNNSFQNPTLGKTFGVTNKIVSITGNILNSFGYKFISVNCVPTTNITNIIQEIKSEISPGETITIKATGSSGQIKFDNTKNIVFAKAATTSLVLLPKETATFIKTDNSIGPINGVYYNETWQLISVNKTY